MVKIYMAVLFIVSLISFETQAQSVRKVVPHHVVLSSVSDSLIEDVDNDESKSELICLALAIYHEARGETKAGQKAIGLVILNRSRKSGDSVCDTIWAKNGSQFPWVRKATHRLFPREENMWIQAQAKALILFQQQTHDITRGAIYFCNPPACRGIKGEITVKIGNHLFFKD